MGGMAEIFRAHTHGAHGFVKTCVIKRILPQLVEDSDEGHFVERFIDEAKVMVQLAHPKVVQVLDFGEVEGQYYMAMEYVQGIDGAALLRRCAHRRCRPTTGIAVHIAAEVLDALDYAHSLTDDQGVPMGIVHRDVSPSNIFLSELGQVKLGDFGIARVAAWRERTEPGGLRGKYGYMSPEAVSEGLVNHRADLFSVGVVLAEMLMIRRLFMADNPLEVLLKVRDVDLGRLDKYGQHIHPDLRQILEAALARDPRLRYQDAATFRDTLHRYLFDHGLMVRSKEVRQFLMRLQEVDQAPTGEQPSLPVEAPRQMLSAVPPLGGTVDTLVVRTGAFKDTSIASRDVTRGVDGSALAQAVAAAAEEQIEAEPAAAEPPPKPGQPRKRKRRITLAPPPKPAPVPTGLPGTGERPRLATADALAAVPEVEGDTGIDSFVHGHHRFPEIALSIDETSADDPEAVAAALVLTPVAEPTPLPSSDLEGQLEERSLVRVLFELALEEETGLLVLRRDQIVKEIYLENGDPEYVASNMPQELFGQYLKQMGVISAGELSMALAMLPHFEGKLGNTLVALKLLRPMEVLRHLTHQVRQKLLDVFAWDDGTYAFHRDKVFEQEAAPLGLDAFEMISAGVQAMPVALVDQRIYALMNQQLKAITGPPVPPEAFRMAGKARLIFDKLTGEQTLGELLARFDDREEQEIFSRVVYLLAETGLVA